LGFYFMNTDELRIISGKERENRELYPLYG
jgi:hypothetical protein